MRVTFDTRELYFLTQYLPVQRVLARRGVECSFVAYHNRPTVLDALKAAFERDDLPVTWCGTKEDGLEHYRRQQPDWVFFGNSYRYVDELPSGTRTAMLYHGIGMKSDVYSPGLVRMDVRFMEGPHYERRVRASFPHANLESVGYAKLDPMFGPAEDRPRVDLASLGLDPGRPTLLYAPTVAPSSFPNMADEWPAHFAEFNLIVKPHYLSYFSSSRKSHRRKMAIWSEAPNCYVAPIEQWNALPFLAAAELLISDLSSLVFEFAATGKPAVWCDFLHLHLFRRGPFRYRFLRRMCEVYDEFRDVAAHARRYADLHGVVEAELRAPERHAAGRRRATAELIGPTDGRVSERIADYLQAARQRTAEPRTAGAAR